MGELKVLSKSYQDFIALQATFCVKTYLTKSGDIAAAPMENKNVFGKVEDYINMNLYSYEGTALPIVSKIECVCVFLTYTEMIRTALLSCFHFSFTVLWQKESRIILMNYILCEVDTQFTI